MKRMVALLIAGLLLCLTVASCVSANDEEKNTTRNHGPIYVNPKPAKGYDEPGFIVGYYDCIGFSSETVHYLYSPHLLFGWSITNTGLPFPLKYSLQIAAFSSRVEFSSFDRTFSGFFSNTEPGFVCGFVYDNCHFSYAFNYTDW